MVFSAMPSSSSFVEHPPDVLVVGDHDVVVEPLAALALVLLGAVGPEVHGRVLYQTKNGFPSL